MPSPTIVLISRDTSLLRECEQATESIPQSQLTVIGHVREAEAYLRRDELGLALLHLPRGADCDEAAHLLRMIATMKRPAPTIVIADRYNEEQAQHLLRLGAAHYLGRPLDSGRLAHILDTLTLRARTTQCVSSRPSANGTGNNGATAVPFLTSGTLGFLMNQIEIVAPQDTTLLLSGETGTGKTRLARLVHDLSPRRDEPLLVVNCGALAENLIESELFGHVRGAFTGADQTRAGKFATVGTGTLLLDEVDALPPSAQVKLLRAVEERVFEPVGANQSQTVRARLIAASNKSLEAEVEAGRFRTDLYYRLNVVGFYLPPLRERRDEIRPLITSFLAEFVHRLRRPVRGLAPQALAALERYDWPGNIRELRNVIERAVALCPSQEIQYDDLPSNIRNAAWPATRDASRAEPSCLVASSASLHHARGKAELARITEALEKHRNNRLRAAVELGISRRTLYKKLHRYGLMGC